MKRAVVTFFFIQVFVLVSGHEFWLEPLKYRFNVKETAIINFKVGDNYFGEQWVLKKEKLIKLELHYQKVVKDIRESVIEDSKKDNLSVTLPVEGTYMVAMQSKPAFSEDPGNVFNEYLKGEGLDDAYNHRKKTNTLDSAGREYYARYSKLLLQAGKKTDETYKKRIGLPIEIIPQQNPYTRKVGDPVKFIILFNGKPLFGAKAKVWNRYNNRTSVQTIYTQQDGSIETHISNTGAWMVSVVKMVPKDDPKADWESYWGSLTFGIE